MPRRDVDEQLPDPPIVDGFEVVAQEVEVGAPSEWAVFEDMPTLLDELPEVVLGSYGS